MSFTERSSLFQRVLYQRFHCKGHSKRRQTSLKRTVWTLLKMQRASEKRTASLPRTSPGSQGACLRFQYVVCGLLCDGESGRLLVVPHSSNTGVSPILLFMHVCRWCHRWLQQIGSHDRQRGGLQGGASGPKYDQLDP